MRRELRIGVIVLAALGGCAGDDPDVSDTAAEALQPRVAEIRELAVQRRADQVTTKLAELRLVIEDLRQRGELSEQGAEDVLAAADAVQGQLALITTTTQPPPPERADEDDDDRDHEEEEDDDDEDDD